MPVPLRENLDPGRACPGTAVNAAGAVDLAAVAVDPVAPELATQSKLSAATSAAEAAKRASTSHRLSGGVPSAARRRPLVNEWSFKRIGSATGPRTATLRTTRCIAKPRE